MKSLQVDAFRGHGLSRFLFADGTVRNAAAPTSAWQMRRK